MQLCSVFYKSPVNVLSYIHILKKKKGLQISQQKPCRDQKEVTHFSSTKRKELNLRILYLFLLDLMYSNINSSTV